MIIKFLRKYGEYSIGDTATINVKSEIDFLKKTNTAVEMESKSSTETENNEKLPAEPAGEKPKKKYKKAKEQE